MVESAEDLNKDFGAFIERGQKVADALPGLFKSNAPDGPIYPSIA